MMKSQQLILCSLLFCITTARGQMAAGDIAGEYYLHGVMEVASGFALREDHSFSFFFSYGAMDRSGTGTWKVEENNIILNSANWPGSDFKLEKQEHRRQKEIVVQVKDKSKMLLGYIGGILSGGGQVQELQSDNDGVITFAAQTTDTISLYHQFYSDALSVFPVKDQKANYFEFTFLPHLGTVFFRNFILTPDKQELTGGNPLLKEGQVYHYVKME